MDQLDIQSVTGTKPGVRILKLTGPFTLATVFDFQTVVREGSAPLTIIDLSGVPYMDSAALGSVLGFHASCHREGKRYGLVGVSDRLRTLFRVAGVDGMMPLYASLEDAEARAAAA
jgi:anti-sigma B factor antagonist